MLPSTTSVMLNQGLVGSNQEAFVTSHMSFFSNPSPLFPHLIFPNTTYGTNLQNSLETLTSSSPRVGDQLATNLSDLGSSSIQESSGHVPWPWGEEGSLRMRPPLVRDQDLNDINKIHNNISVKSLPSINGAKRMKKVMKARRKVREPRFCFKTMSDVDVLNDGYKWRKYGQKVVKNTQHPRSYYRCTQDNCRVKKRVERLAEDARMVITTYEGRHAHSPPHDEDETNQASSHINFFC